MTRGGGAITLVYVSGNFVKYSIEYFVNKNNGQ